MLHYNKEKTLSTNSILHQRCKYPLKYKDGQAEISNKAIVRLMDVFINKNISLHKWFHKWYTRLQKQVLIDFKMIMLHYLVSIRSAREPVLTVYYHVLWVLKMLIINYSHHMCGNSRLIHNLGNDRIYFSLNDYFVMFCFGLWSN